jgi:hypothetical protein
MRTNRILHNLLIVLIVVVVIGGFVLRPQKARATKFVDSSGTVITESSSGNNCFGMCENNSDCGTQESTLPFPSPQ